MIRLFRSSAYLLLCLPCLASAQPQRPYFETDPITQGFVLYEGQYLAPPYVLIWDNGLLALNELPLQAPRLNRQSRRPQQGNGRRPSFNMPPSHAAAWIERRLGQGSLLVAWADQPSVFISGEKVSEILGLLVGEESEQAKIDGFKQMGLRGVSLGQWTEWVRHFSGSVKLQERLSGLESETSQPIFENDESWYSDTAIALFTISGFILSVLALGLLLKSRYPGTLPDDPGATRQVVELVLLLVVLNVYDLICTLFANAIGGLWELNPFVRSMLSDSLLVVLYKVGLTTGAAILLIVARRYRIAQFGAYWASVLYTVLILRWITYNAMFIA